MQTIAKELISHTNFKLPRVGYGTYTLSGQQQLDFCVESALESGYKLFDTAVMYGNEKQIGTTFKKLEIPRDQYIIQTKILPEDLTYERTLKSVLNSLKNLQLDYIDVYLLHWPGANTIKDRQGAWRALEEMKVQGKIMEIGVSNFLPRHIESLEFKHKPILNQIEIHPLYIEQDTINYCKKQHIIILIDNPTIQALAQKYKKNIPQIILKWGVQNDFCVLPRSKDKDHIRQNIDIFDFELSQDEIQSINNMHCNYKTDWNPESVK